MENLFIQFSEDEDNINLNFEKFTLMTGFVLQGHILPWKLAEINNYFNNLFRVKNMLFIYFTSL